MPLRQNYEACLCRVGGAVVEEKRFLQVLETRTKGNAVAKCYRNHEVLFSVRRRQFLGYSGAGVLAAMLPGCGNDDIHSTPYQQTIALGQQMIQQAVTDPSNPVAAISVAMVKANTVVWQQAFGSASVPGQIKATPQTRFNIGSVSKLFPALAATILVDRGLITLDTPIIKYLPTFTMLSPEYAQITTRHLLSHASGLPGTNGRNLFTFQPVAGYAADTQAELANSHLKHLPGELAVYCNDGFTMVEQIVLAMTGQSFADFVQSAILAPLKMTDSSYLTSVPSGGSFSLPYVKGTQYQEFVNAYATGGLSSTPTDMMNLAQMIYGGGVFQGQRIVSAAGIAQMGTDQTKSGTPIREAGRRSAGTNTAATAGGGAIPIRRRIASQSCRATTVKEMRSAFAI